MVDVANLQSQAAGLRELGAAGATLWRYWLSLRGSEIVPERRRFDPMAVARILPLVSILEHEAPMVWRVRLTGTEIDRRSGRCVQGANFIDLVDPGLKELLDRRLAQLTAQPCGGVIIRHNARHSGRLYAVRAVLLPLRCADGRIRQVISSNEEIAPCTSPDPSDPFAMLRTLQGGFLDIGAGSPA